MANVKYAQNACRDFRYRVPKDLRLEVMDIIRKWAKHPEKALIDEITVLSIPPNAFLKYTPPIDGIIFAVSFIYPWGDISDDIIRVTGISSNLYKKAEKDSDTDYRLEDAIVYNITDND